MEKMSHRIKSQPMPVKYWSFAGLMITDWCSAACASCYLRCSPAGAAWMDVETALRIWEQLQSACPHGCRVHLTGGEPFGDWPRLIEIASRAQADGLGPLEIVETNAYWADDEREMRDRLKALDAAGMKKLSISADPFHQQFVPIDRVRRLARIAEDVLGAERVQVRWRDWMEQGGDTNPAAMDDETRRKTFADWIARKRDRLNGRAAEALAGLLPLQPVEAFEGHRCREVILRGRHVHVGPDGGVMPGVCAGILLGRADRDSISEIWGKLNADHESRPIVGALARGGPAELLPLARRTGFVPAGGYASKCHRCYCIRRHLAATADCAEELGPGSLYVNEKSLS
jgi:MoaA/NifB/PqqE/SkfB family radical SAM enzyme